MLNKDNYFVIKKNVLFALSILLVVLILVALLVEFLSIPKDNNFNMDLHIWEYMSPSLFLAIIIWDGVYKLLADKNRPVVSRIIKGIGVCGICNYMLIYPVALKRSLISTAMFNSQYQLSGPIKDMWGVLDHPVLWTILLVLIAFLFFTKYAITILILYVGAIISVFIQPKNIAITMLVMTIACILGELLTIVEEPNDNNESVSVNTTVDNVGITNNKIYYIMLGVCLVLFIISVITGKYNVWQSINSQFLGNDYTEFLAVKENQGNGVGIAAICISFSAGSLIAMFVDSIIGKMDIRNRILNTLLNSLIHTLTSIWVIDLIISQLISVYAGKRVAINVLNKESVPDWFWTLDKYSMDASGVMFVVWAVVILGILAFSIFLAANVWMLLGYCMIYGLLFTFVVIFVNNLTAGSIMSVKGVWLVLVYIILNYVTQILGESITRDSHQSIINFFKEMKAVMKENNNI